jgi:hypothetical protein
MPAVVIRVAPWEDSKLRPALVTGEPRAARGSRRSRIGQNWFEELKAKVPSK